MIDHDIAVKSQCLFKKLFKKVFTKAFNFAIIGSYNNNSTMKAILIDPKNKTISEVQKKHGYEDTCRLIECETMTVACYLENGDCVYADDEGAFNEDRHYSSVEGQIFVGNLLVVGSTKDGDDKGADSTVEYVKAITKFIPRHEAEDHIARPEDDPRADLEDGWKSDIEHNNGQ